MASRTNTLGSASTGSGGGSSAYGPPSGQSRDGKLPLPDDFFRTPSLNSKETKYLVNLAKRACKEVVFYSRRAGGPMNWVHLSSDSGVDVFQGIDENATEANKSITYLRGSTRIYASIDDVADFFKLDTPMKLSGFTQTVGKDLLDQKTLYDLARPSAENPKHYVGVKWTAVESPSKLARNRDFCYLECHDEFIDTNSKKRGWVRSLHSIRLPFCPPLDKTHGLVRGSLYRSGFVFLESDDKTYVDAVHTLHMDIKGNAPNWLKIMVMKRRIKNISEVNRYFQMRRLCEGRLLGDLELPSKSGVAHCQVCAHKFGLFSRKSACRKCGKVVCSPCGHHFVLDYAGHGAKKVKICAHCSDRVVHGDEGSQHRPMSHVGGRRVNSVSGLPIYDQSPSSCVDMSTLRRQRSVEEHYMKNEDARGMTDIEDAKRMHREFEEAFARSMASSSSSAQLHQQQHPSPPPLGPPKRSAAGMPAGVVSAPNGMKSRRGGESYDHLDDSDMRLPQSKPEQPLPRKRSSNNNMSAYQEFMKTERARLKNIAGSTAPSVLPSRAVQKPLNGQRPSLVHTAGPPAPGALLSRARQEQSFGQFPQRPVELQHTLPPPREAQQPIDSIRISSDWEPDFLYTRSKLQRLRDNASTLSDDPVGAPIRRSDLSVRPSRVSSGDLQSSFVDRDRVPDEMVRRGQSSTMPPSYPSPTSTDSFSNASPSVLFGEPRPSHPLAQAPQRGGAAHDFHQEFRRSYFDARNSGINELQERVQSQPATDDEGDFRFGYDADSSVSDDTDVYDKEYEVPVPAKSMTKRSRRHTTTERPAARDPVQHLATVMALSAMQLYEKENGLDLQVSEETRQAALKKMVEIYSNEIDRTNADEQQQDMRRTARSASVTAPGPTGFYPVDRHHAQTVMGTTSQPHESFMEYRDLSDLSASAFKAYQKCTLADSGSSLPRSDAEPSLPSSVTGASRRLAASGLESKNSSRRNAPLGFSENQSRDAGTTRGSIPNSDSLYKPASMIRDDVSDTFSELDLIDLPHLMRVDQAATTNERSPDRLSQESEQTEFSEVSTSQLSTAVDLTASQPQLNEQGAPGEGAMYASLHAEPGLYSPPSAARSNSISSLSDDGLIDSYEGDTTSRSKMTLSELERYRASLAELMAEYNHDHPLGLPGSAKQPEREYEPDRQHEQRNASYKSPNARAAQPELENVLQELYL